MTISTSFASLTDEIPPITWEPSPFSRASRASATGGNLWTGAYTACSIICLKSAKVAKPVVVPAFRPETGIGLSWSLNRIELSLSVIFCAEGPQNEQFLGRAAIGDVSRQC